MKIMNNEKGVTLLEVLLSLTILSIIFISLMSFFPQMGMMNKHNEEKTQSVNSAKLILNKWKSDVDVINSLRNPSSPSWPSPPDTSHDKYYSFETTDQITVIKIWKSPEEGFEIHDYIRAYRIQVQIYKDKTKSQVLSETFGYVIVD